MSSPLARAYLELIPSLKGASGHISKDLAGIAPKVGQQMGQNLSKSMAASMNMQAVGARIQSVGQQISSVGSTLTKAITLPIAGATLAAGGLVATLGWKRLVSIDTAKAQLTGLGYEAKDVDRITDQLVTDLDGGMMTLADATTAAAGAMASGVQEGSELTKYIQTLDSAVVGATGTFYEMNKIFSDTADLGYLSANSFDMLRQRMPGVSQAFQDFTGKTGDDFRQMLNDGEISLEDFITVMDDFAGGMASAYADSWAGMVENTKNWIGILGQQLLGGVFEQSKDALNEFLTLLSSDAAQEWAAETGEAIGRGFSQVIEWTKDAISWWQDLDSETQKFYLTLAGIAVAAGPFLIVAGRIVTIIGSIVSAGGRLVGWLGRAAGAFGLTAGSGGAGGLLTTLRKFVGRAGPIGLVVGGLIAMWENSEPLRESVRKLGGAVGGLIESFGGLIEPLLAPAGELFGTLFDLAGDLAGVLGDVLAVAIETILIPAIEGLTEALDLAATSTGFFLDVMNDGWEEAIMNNSEDILEMGGNLMRASQDIGGFTADVAGEYARLQGRMGRFFARGWQPTMTGMEVSAGIAAGGAGAQFAKIPGFFNTGTSALRILAGTRFDQLHALIDGKLSLLPNMAGNWAGNMMTSFVSGIIGRISDVGTSAARVVDRVRTGFSNAPTVLLSAGRALISGFLSGIRERFADVGSRARDVIERATSPFSGLGDRLKNSGSSLIGGFISGITSRIGDVASAASRAVQRARDFFPNSPAKEGPLSGKGYVSFSGQALAEDFAKGMTGGTSSVVAAAEEIVRSAALSQVPDFLPESWQAGLDSQLSMTPSLAMSGAAASNSSSQSFEASLVGAEIEIGPDGLARFVDGRVIVAMKDDKVTRISRQSSQSQERRDAKAGAR